GASPSSVATISSLRLMIQTGLPCHSTRRSSQGFMPAMSTSTGAPAALARSEGAKLATKGTAVETPPTAPMAAVTPMTPRRDSSTGWIEAGFGALPPGIPGPEAVASLFGSLMDSLRSSLSRLLGKLLILTFCNRPLEAPAQQARPRDGCAAPSMLV